MIRCLSGGLSETGPTPHRPFRDAHHSASMPSLVGGGLRAKPGEVSLAHLGVLFLDELPEFQRAALEVLRQPMETGQTTVARANAHVTYPARFQLIAAMKPCRCGYLGDPAQACTRAPRCAADYQAKIFGHLFDRIDLHVDVPAVNLLDLSQPPPSEPSKSVAARVAKARALEKDRYQEFSDGKPLRTNAAADGALLEKVAAPDSEGRRLRFEAADRMRLSARLSPGITNCTNVGGFERRWPGGSDSHRRGRSLSPDRVRKEFSHRQILSFF